MPREGAYGSVLIYYMVLAVIVAGVNLFWGSLFDFIDLRAILRPTAPQASGHELVEFLLTPIFAIIGLYLVSGVCHLLLMMMRGAQHSFETSSRVFAYSYSPSAFAIVPVVGAPVGFVWMIVLAIIGLREAHQTDGAKAAAAVLIPVFLLFCFLVVAVLVMVTLGLLETKL